MLLEIQEFHLCLEKFMFLLLVVCMILTVRGVLGVYFQCKAGCVHSPSQLIMHFYINVQINPWFIAKGFWLFISTYNSIKSKVRKNKSLVIIRLWKNKWKQKHDIKKKKIQRRQKGWVSKENVRYCDFISNYHACLYCHYWLGVDSKFTTWQSCHISNFVFTPTKQIF